jgi:putative ABC transport system ATP-binding protein
MNVVMQATDLRKVYGQGDNAVDAVDGISFDLGAGECVAVVGPSGCGKSTLLHLCGGMDHPTAGRVVVGGVDLSLLGDEALTQVRRERIGFVFQSFNLLPTLTLAENIALPLLLAGISNSVSHTRAREGASQVGLEHRLGHYPSQVSGGELQRAAIARALVHRPVLLIADEPTGNLDTENGQSVLQLLKMLTSQRVAVLLATHDRTLASAADRVLCMRDGREMPSEESGSVGERLSFDPEWRW